MRSGKSRGLLAGLSFVLAIEVALYASFQTNDPLNVLLVLGGLVVSLIVLRLLAKRPHPERVGTSGLLTGTIVFGLLLFFGTLASSLFFYRPHHTVGQLTACKSNLKNLGTAMEMYSTDWSGKYPTEITMLTPNYLKTIPECPTAGEVTYTLQTGENTVYNTAGFQDYYFLQCEGENHTSFSVPENYPQYDGIRGLIER